MSNIREIIRSIADTNSKTRLVVGSVKAIDHEARTCDVNPIDESAPILGVNLQANQGSTVGVVVWPKLGSFVVVALYDDYEAGVVVLTDVIDRYDIKVGDMSLSLSAQGIVMNEGALGGLVKVVELTQRLNTIEQDLNSLKTAFSAWVPVAQDGGAALKTAVSTWATSTLTPTQRSDIENQNVKQ